PPEVAMVTLQSMGADIVGLNCSTGPDAMLPLVEAMAEVATIPILAKPNAGLPELIDGETQYRMTPQEFSDACGRLLAAGVSVIGGCCGTTPEHIAQLVRDHKNDELVKIEYKKRRIITSERRSVEFVVGGPFIIIGERINPTGKKALKEELTRGSLDMVCDFARAQEADGAAVLDVNFGMNGIDEKETMVRAVNELVYTTDLPLCIDSSFPEVVEAALRIYPGRALINSISGEDKIHELLPIAKKYGAMFILLPLNSSGLPKDNNEKHANVDLVLGEAKKHGLTIDDCIVDVLVSTVGADEDAALKCFETALHCKNDLNVPTTCGLSNISFGLPQRTFINTAFLSIALSNGLTSAISNPGQELLKYTAFASDLLLKKAGSVDRYINNVPGSDVAFGRTDKNAVQNASLSSKSDKGQKSPDAGDASGNFSEIAMCVINGEAGKIEGFVKKVLDEGAIPGELIDKELIPAINEVGARYEAKRVFLPQLIAGANAMKAAMDIIEPLLVRDDSEIKETIVVATVEGDIHDIGKNLVVLMLKNYGYNVIDLGKDVPASVIVDEAMDRDAAVIGLSALMTTTMLKMKEVVEEAKARGCTSKIVIGGACITQSFADEIGADGYSEDAASCVKLVKSLL
ncbi:MAG: dihydropteroate synthase, partial [Lachnospiraceae bacterium]|nr:dihydropteroate synthase [Lachnospiraceae bacterium]